MAEQMMIEELRKAIDEGRVKITATLSDLGGVIAVQITPPPKPKTPGEIAAEQFVSMGDLGVGK